MSDGFFLLGCRGCDPDLHSPLVFSSATERGHWAAAHKKGTGHNSWFVVDPNQSWEDAKAAHAETVAWLNTATGSRP